ncbi:MAG: 16S rRNA (cytosine1402-N4)-methyltransferase [Parcubacteria group bacterium Gr01-1014_2]|nr:MAG: 16S rRNA (cytosine1402-N4)-methyltransferase [Parcubacteria group bacterium Gr01-1014_2]
MEHIPVLLNEVIQYLNLKPSDKVIDATFSSGGHGEKILEKIKPNGKLLAIELDAELFNKAKEGFLKINQIILVNGNYRNLKKIAQENNFIEADGVLLDLGLSSWHFEGSKRGFTFQKDESLDMRFWQGQELTAREIINQWSPQEIEKVLKEYGEEKFARQISKAIIEARKQKPIISTFQLVEAIKNAVPFWYQKGRRLHFATKTFQALRIAVNDELGNLKSVLGQFPEVLKKGGRGAVISFHSLEDRIVKQAFKEFKKAGIAEILTKKPIRPSEGEIAGNPRARSAKMRVIETI